MTFRILFIPRLVRPVTHTFRAETVSRPHIIDRYRFFQPVVFYMQDVRKVDQFLFLGFVRSEDLIDLFKDKLFILSSV